MPIFGARVYLKTPNAPGQRTFSRCAAPFFLEIRQYSCEKMSCSAQKFLAAGHIGSFQIHPKSRAMRGCASKLACGHRIGPRRMQRFYGNLRRIRSFPSGRQSRRPLQQRFILPVLRRGGRLCPPAECTGFYGNLRRIRSFPAGRCVPASGRPTSVTLLRRERL